jgi:hypothetical protein
MINTLAGISDPNQALWTFIQTPQNANSNEVINFNFYILHLDILKKLQVNSGNMNKI